MAQIDQSPAAWSGYFSTKGVTGGETKSGTEEESLWYIFNTLQDPAPNPDKMKDPYAKKAMREVLSVSARSDFDGDHEYDDGTEPRREYSCVLGLRTALYPYQRRSAAAMIQREAQPAPMLDPRLQACNTPTGQEYYYDKEEGTIVRGKKLYSEARGGTMC
jgi:hypothetical protein